MQIEEVISVIFKYIDCDRDYVNISLTNKLFNKVIKHVHPAAKIKFVLEPIQNYDIPDTGFAWQDFCCPKDITDDYDCIDEYVSHILEVPRRIVERNYWYKKVYTYDYYFMLCGDDENLYVVQTNIRMKKCFQGKWNWLNESYNARMYKIAISKITNINNLYIKTHPADEHDDLYMIWGGSSNYYYGPDDYYVPYDLDNESEDEQGMFEDYYDMIDRPPYTMLAFLDPIPEGGVVVEIPCCINENTSIPQKVGYMMTHRPCKTFGNGR
jgi:hypothetical protein